MKLSPDGCIPAYKGFHPHSLAGNNYAFIREKNGWMTKIQEKKQREMYECCACRKQIENVTGYTAKQLEHYNKTKGRLGLT